MDSHFRGNDTMHFLNSINRFWTFDKLATCFRANRTKIYYLDPLFYTLEQKGVKAVKYKKVTIRPKKIEANSGSTCQKSKIV